MNIQPERLRRWRLILGQEGAPEGADAAHLGSADQQVDDALSALYQPDNGGNREDQRDRPGGLGPSMPSVPQWFETIRAAFPPSVVQVMQRDVVDRLSVAQLLSQPDILDHIEPDIHLVATLLGMGSAIPPALRETANRLIQRLTSELLERLALPLQQAVRGSTRHRAYQNHPRHYDIHWHRTIQANLKHYQPDYDTIIPAIRIGHGRQQAAIQDVILCVDQSGSMASSVIYASVFAAVLAAIPALSTRLVLFDTAVVDLSDRLSNPADILLGAQLGGGTDINQALGYCNQLIQQPEQTLLVLISDLYEGGNESTVVQRVNHLVQSGVHLVTLLALDDEGTPSFNHALAQQFAALGVLAFGCTPDQFPSLMAAALQHDDLQQWAVRQDDEVIS